MAANCGVKGPGHNMALYLVVKHWLQQWRESGNTLGEGEGDSIVVGHGLRPESGPEALQVQHWIENLGEQLKALHPLFCSAWASTFRTFGTNFVILIGLMWYTP